MIHADYKIGESSLFLGMIIIFLHLLCMVITFSYFLHLPMHARHFFLLITSSYACSSLFPTFYIFLCMLVTFSYFLHLPMHARHFFLLFTSSRIPRLDSCYISNCLKGSYVGSFISFCESGISINFFESLAKFSCIFLVKILCWELCWKLHFIM